MDARVWIGQLTVTDETGGTPTQHPPPEELFRSCALVLASNAAAEYAFLSTFFGQHSMLDVGRTSSSSDRHPPGGSPFRPAGLRRSATDASSASAAGVGSVPIREGTRDMREEAEEGGGDVDSDGGQTVGTGTGRPVPMPMRTPTRPGAELRRIASSASGTTSAYGGPGGRAAQEEKVQRVVVDGLWKQVMEPALEYTRVRDFRRIVPNRSRCKEGGAGRDCWVLSRDSVPFPLLIGDSAVQNFINALLDPVPPSTISVLAMVRLNDSLLTALASSAVPTDPSEPADAAATAPESAADAAGMPACPVLEPHLLAVRMQLLPVLSKLMSAQVDSLRRINGSPAHPAGGSSSSSGVGGMLARATGVGGSGGAGAGSVKDSVVKVVIGRYAELFNAAIALWSSAEGAVGAVAGDVEAEEVARRTKPVDGDDEMAFARCVSLSYLSSGPLTPPPPRRGRPAAEKLS